MKLGYLGPRTNSEKAVRALNIKFEPIAFGSMEEVVEALNMGMVERAVIPVRNSFRGDIKKHIAWIEENNFRVVEEVTIPVVHSLGYLGREIGFILSHIEALGQCADYLNRRFGEVYREAVKSTEVAARFVSELGIGAAIAPLETCRHYKLNILDEDIVKGNESTFHVCAK